MRRFFAGLGFAMGFAWLFRRRRPRTAPAAAPDPAEELKQKLAEARDPAAETPFATEPPPPPPEPALDERRREVHERARESIDRMRGTDEAPPPGEG